MHFQRADGRVACMPPRLIYERSRGMGHVPALSPPSPYPSLHRVSYAFGTTYTGAHIRLSNVLVHLQFSHSCDAHSAPALAQQPCRMQSCKRAVMATLECLNVQAQAGHQPRHIAHARTVLCVALNCGWCLPLSCTGQIPHSPLLPT